MIRGSCGCRVQCFFRILCPRQVWRSALQATCAQRDGHWADFTVNVLFWVQVFDFELSERDMNDILDLDRNFRMCTLPT